MTENEFIWIHLSLKFNVLFNVFRVSTEWDWPRAHNIQILIKWYDSHDVLLGLKRPALNGNIGDFKSHA